MGNTNLVLPPESIELILEEGINLPPSSINALRRAAAEAFESSSRHLPPFKYEERRKPVASKFKRSASFYSEEAFLRAISLDRGAISDLDIAFLPLGSSTDALAVAGGVALPSVITDGERAEVIKLLENAKNSGIMYALVSNIGQIALVKSLGLAPVGDFRLNITNGECAETYRKMGLVHHILSPELTLPKARDIGGGLITYGRIPLMITERCFIKENFGCKNCASATLTDRKGEKFPIRREFGHRNIIFNSLPTYMADRAEELRQYRISSQHLIFSVEKGEEVIKVLKSHKSGSKLSTAVRRIGRR